MAYIQKRVRENGRASYRALERIKGFPARSATFDKRYEPLKWGRDKEGEFMLNKNSSFTVKNRKRTLGELIDRYSSKILSDKKDIARQTIQLNWWKAQLVNFKLCDISSSTISDYREKLQIGNTHYGKPRSATTVKRYSAVIS